MPLLIVSAPNNICQLFAVDFKTRFQTQSLWEKYTNYVAEIIFHRTKQRNQCTNKDFSPFVGKSLFHPFFFFFF